MALTLFKSGTNIDFIGTRKLPIGLSVVLIVATFVTLFVRGLNFGLDFTGGTLVELSYAEPVEVSAVREQLAGNGFADAVVQHFGTTRDVMVRIPLRPGKESAALSSAVIAALRKAHDEVAVESRPGEAQKCTKASGATLVECHVQVRRVEFVGPQVGSELVEKGGLALIYTLIAILVYVVLAAILAVLGYSLNDTIVVFDRIRENFHRMRRAGVVEIMNASINQTLSRTIITSSTTMLTVLALFFLGGEIMHGFSDALIVGIVVGTYSSIYVATPAVLALGISREDLLPAKKETAEPNRP